MEVNSSSSSNGKRMSSSHETCHCYAAMTYLMICQPLIHGHSLNTHTEADAHSLTLESSAHGWSGPFSERIPSSEHIPSKFRANPEQASQTPYSLVILCNESPWLTDNKEHTLAFCWGEADHAQNRWMLTPRTFFASTI